ncbi:MAG: hypothetical protein H0V19_00975 [Euzebyales bacterium]|nr:hypothetical protein [Euzebyales bacterium]
MAVDERSRNALYVRLTQLLGEEDAGTLMEHLPPAGWSDVAMRADLEHFQAATRADMEGLRTELQTGMGHLRTELLARMETLEQRLLAAFRGELVAAVTAQTRAIMFALVGSTATVGGLAVVAARAG